jgi:hypothetical protein
LTGLIGLVAFFGLATPADAEVTPSKASKSVIAATTGATTGGTTGGMVIANPQKPAGPQLPQDMDIVLPTTPPTPPKGDLDLAAVPGGATVNDPTGGQDDPCAPVASCPQDGECTPGTTVDPDCRPPQDPCNQPGGPTCPGPDCQDRPTTPRSVINRPDDCTDGDCTPIPGTSGHNCPGTDDDCDDPIARDRGEDCDPCQDDDTQDHAVRARGDEDRCDPCADQQDRPAPPRAGDDADQPATGGEDCGGTTGTDGGTTGGGRLPHTGAELATYGTIGVALVGLGFGIKRLSRTFA